jgi:hypothetical protein
MVDPNQSLEKREVRKSTVGSIRKEPGRSWESGWIQSLIQRESGLSQP